MELSPLVDVVLITVTGLKVRMDRSVAALLVLMLQTWVDVLILVHVPVLAPVNVLVIAPVNVPVIALMIANLVETVFTLKLQSIKSLLGTSTSLPLTLQPTAPPASLTHSPLLRSKPFLTESSLSVTLPRVTLQSNPNTFIGIKV